MGRIVLIAPGEHIRVQGEKLRENLKEKENLEIHVAHMEAAVELARGFDRKRVDVLIARGDTATMLKQSALPFPVVDIGISDEDIVRCIIRAEVCSGLENPTIGIIGAETFVERIRSFFSILRPKVNLYTAISRENIREVVVRAKKEGADVLIGGDLACRLAKQHEMKTVMIGTSYELVAEAYSRAMDIQTSIEVERKKKQEIHTIFNTVTDGIISMDEQGTIRTMNEKAESILRKKIAGTQELSLGTVLEGERAAAVRESLKTGKRNSGIPVSFGGRDYSMNVTPIMVDGKSRGAVITLSNVSDIQRVETKLRRNLYLKGNVAEYTFQDIRGKSEALRETVRLAEVFAPLQSNVLIIGQTGTGKEMFAQSIHNASERKDGPFVAVNCGSIPDNLIESELFGYVDGAFTGAKKGGKIGLFELAHNGTIFLDEISEMSISGQVRLLRVIQERQVRRVGSDMVIPVNVRIIAACNTSLKKMVEEQRFRKDLYYRLSVLVLQIPELEQRGGDVGLLADYFIEEYNKRFHKNVFLSEEAKKALENLEWEGNIRQLRNFCERVDAVHPGGVVTAEFVCQNYRSSYVFDTLEEDRENRPAGKREEGGRRTGPEKKKYSREELMEVLEKCGGNHTKAASELHISRTTLWNYLRE